MLGERIKNPANLPRRLVASKDRVYMTLGYRAPISELDAATGETLTTFDGSQNPFTFFHAIS